MRARALEIAINRFGWRPGLSLFRALELDAYLESGQQAASPCLDLGCGDGIVARTLRDAGIVTGPVLGLDLSAVQLDKAQALGQHAALCRADVEAVPFAEGVFESVVCNGVLEALPHSPAGAIREAGRVLRTGGLLFLSVPTDRFVPNMLWPGALGRFSPALARRYTTRLNRRLEHHGAYRRLADWREWLRAAGLEILYERSFLSSPSGRMYSVLIMHALRPVQVLKLLWREPPAFLRRPLARLIQRCAQRDALDPAEGGYVLFVARKTWDRAENKKT
jgi:SAM-dependent methyltransferase